MLIFLEVLFNKIWSWKHTKRVFGYVEKSFSNTYIIYIIYISHREDQYIDQYIDQSHFTVSKCISLIISTINVINSQKQMSVSYSGIPKPLFWIIDQLPVLISH